LSDHFDGRRFFNPNGPALEPFSSVPRLLLSRRARWPHQVVDPPIPIPDRGSAPALVTFVGHSTFLIQTSDEVILTDPVFSDHAGPGGIIGPRRVRRPAISLDALPPVSLILLSHNHYDHCDLPTLGALGRRFDPLVVTLLGNRALLRSAGLRRIEELDWWQHAATKATSITATPAHHFSARGPFDRNRALWGGFILGVEGRHIYFAGDTAYTEVFRALRSRVGPVDLALLPIGAYEPRWFMRSVHMNPEEAVRAHIELGSTLSIAMHFGTFQLTTEGIDAPAMELRRACAEHGIPDLEFRVPASGESIYLR